MNKDKLREELAEDEGCKFEIYLDHLGLPTFGIGHLVVEGDPEHVSYPLIVYWCAYGYDKCSLWILRLR